MSEKPLVRLEFNVENQYTGWRLDNFLHARIPRLSRNRIQQMLKAQEEYKGIIIRPSDRVYANQVVVLFRPAVEEPSVPRYYDAIYQDPYMFALSKPAGLPVHPTARFFKNTLTSVLKEQFAGTQVPSIAHRLDRETSGLVLLGFGKVYTSRLKKAFRDRKVSKTYLALVHGSSPDEFEVAAPLEFDEDSIVKLKMRTCDNGLDAYTRFKTVERRGDFSLIQAFPKTGRQHQIRVHVAHAGYPIVGDKIYGSDPKLFIEFADHGWNDSMAEKLLLPRHALHAYSATFHHPESGEEMELKAPLPDDISTFWKSIEQ